MTSLPVAPKPLVICGSAINCSLIALGSISRDFVTPVFWLCWLFAVVLLPASALLICPHASSKVAPMILVTPTMLALVKPGLRVERFGKLII